MFRTIPPGPQPAWKRPVYLVCSTILGGLLGFLLSEVLAYFNLQSALIDSPRLSLVLDAIVVATAIGGFFIGRVWWHIIYVERRWQDK